MTPKIVTRTLAARNGGPGLTSAELAEEIGMPEAMVRNLLSHAVFREGTVTCDTAGRYKLGDPIALLMT